MRKYRFDEIAINSTKKKKPTEEDRFTYIGLEHIDPDCFNIVRWGSDVAPIGDKLIMQKGDVLFGKRRAYQRKVGIAPFDGIFSAHGMVLKPNAKVIDASFFPFFIRSDKFMETAMRISVGGLSPTINWKDLAKQEFELPSLEEQKVLAEKLWAAYRLKEGYKKLLAATDEMVKSQFIEMFSSYEKEVQMSTLFEFIRNGVNIKQDTNPIGFPITRIETIADGYVDLSRVGYAGIHNEKYSSYYMRKDDILVSHINSLKHIGKCALYDIEGDRKIIHGMNLLCLRPIQDIINPIYALYFLRDRNTRNDIMEITKPAVNQASFSVKDFGNIRVILPHLSEQQRFAGIAEQADKSKYYGLLVIDNLKNTLGYLIKQVA